MKYMLTANDRQEIIAKLDSTTGAEHAELVRKLDSMGIMVCKDIDGNTDLFQF